jgi:hypothetical protein
MTRRHPRCHDGVTTPQIPLVRRRAARRPWVTVLDTAAGGDGALAAGHTVSIEARSMRALRGR